MLTRAGVKPHRGQARSSGESSERALRHCLWLYAPSFSLSEVVGAHYMPSRETRLISVVKVRVREFCTYCGKSPLGVTSKDLCLRLSGANEVVVHIRAVRNPFAAYPAKKTQEATALLKQLYPEVFPVSNILDVALSNTNPCVHPMPTLLSASRIEYCGGDFWLYREGMTPSVWRAMRALDQERVGIRKALGFPPPHSELPEEVGQVFVDQFGHDGILAGRQMKGPKELTDRYLTEDVPMGLVFYSSVGLLAGVATPVVDSVVTLVSAVLGKNMWAEGRTLEGFGLGGLKPAEVLAQLA